MPEETHNRIDLAVEQIECAIELFLSERSDVGALTLAGASEEILGQAVGLAGGQSALQRSYEFAALTHQALHRAQLNWKVFADGENCARNAAKHLRQDEETVTADIRRAAQWMIVRACANHAQLDLPRTDRMAEFDNWFYEHEVGV
jgi:hypothetical protein